MASSGRKVMVCVDGSDVARSAFTWYLENAYREGDDVLVATKAEFTNINFKVHPSKKELEEIVERAQKAKGDVDSFLADFMDTMRAKRIKGNAQALFGDEGPGPLLVQKSMEWQANIIIVGTRGLGKIKSLLLGSVSDFVVKHAKCPVIVVRPEQ